MNINLNFHADLIYHLLVHMNLKNNASNLYSKDYIEYIQKSKQAVGINNNLEEELLEFNSIYLKGFERLALINFIPFCTNSLKETEEELVNQPFYTKEDKEDFLLPFISIAQRESDMFYRKFWEDELKKHSKILEDFNTYIEKEISKFTSIFKYYKVSPKVYISQSLTRNGRGFYMKDNFTAVVPMPKDYVDFSKGFITAFHEMTHQFTDKLLNCDISMNDNTHMLSESVVIITDFYLFKKYNYSLLEEYCIYFGIDKCSEEGLKEKYPIPKELLLKVESLVELL